MESLALLHRNQNLFIAFISFSPHSSFIMFNKAIYVTLIKSEVMKIIPRLKKKHVSKNIRQCLGLAEVWPIEDSIRIG